MSRRFNTLGISSRASVASSVVSGRNRTRFDRPRGKQSDARNRRDNPEHRGSGHDDDGTLSITSVGSVLSGGADVAAVGRDVKPAVSSTDRAKRVARRAAELVAEEREARQVARRQLGRAGRDRAPARDAPVQRVSRGVRVHRDDGEDDSATKCKTTVILKDCDCGRGDCSGGRRRRCKRDNCYPPSCYPSTSCGPCLPVGCTTYNAWIPGYGYGYGAYGGYGVRYPYPSYCSTGFAAAPVSSTSVGTTTDTLCSLSGCYQVSQPTITSCNALGCSTAVGAPNLTGVSDLGYRRFF